MVGAGAVHMQDARRAAGVVIGQDYPAPIVEVKASREAALAAFSEMKRRAEV